MTQEQGWHALRQGQINDAVSLLKQAADQNTQDATPLLGLAQALLAGGHLDQAEGMVRLANQRGAPPESMLVQARVLGERGQRDASSNILKQYLQKNLPNRPLALAFLAEQRIRQGYWDEASTLFLEALQQDPHQVAAIHLEKVIVDMSNAVAARKIRPAEAIKFINKLEYQLPQNPQRSLRFGNYRRAMTNGVALDAYSPVAPVYPGGLSAQASPPSSAAPQQTYSAPTPQNQVRQSSTPLSPPQPTSSPKPRRQVQAAQTTNIYEDRLLTNMERTVRSDFARSMREERKLNEELQQHIKQLGVMRWPSAQENPIDVIPSLNFRHMTVSEQIAERVQKDEFRVTQGSIMAQIYMERCLQGLLQTLPIELAGTLAMFPEELTQLEINSFDGMLNEIDDIVTLDIYELQLQDPATIAVGTFIGEAICRALSASWEYTENALDARLRLGKAKLEPMRVAQAWIANQGGEDVDLRAIIAQARHALPATRFVPRAYEYIDNTKGTQGPALRSILAELWSFYRFSLVRTPGIELVEDLHELWQDDEIVIFSLHERWCPKLPAISQQRSVNAKQQHVIAYIRSTGEFLFIGYRPHLVRLCEHMFKSINEDSIKTLMRILTEYYCPGGTIIRTNEDARNLAQSTGLNALHGPQIQSGKDQLSITFWEITKSKAYRWTLSYDKQRPIAWQMEAAR